jgi:FdhD protein
MLNQSNSSNPVELTVLYDAGVTRRAVVTPIQRLARGARDTDVDLVAVEAPLTIQVRSAARGLPRSLGVVMRTPGEDRDLVMGLLYTEGIIRRRDEVMALTVGANDEAGDVAEVMLTDRIDIDAAVDGRALLGTSACGLCGRLAIERVDALARLGMPRSTAVWPAEVVVELPARLRANQAVFDETGGLHAAGLFRTDGTLGALREDVGRHNAVDKLVGAALDADLLPASDALIAVSGRVAYEIVQKAALAGVAGIVAVGAPSSLAVEAAQAAGLLLVGFARNGRFNVYTGQDRLTVNSQPRSDSIAP